MAGIEGRKAFNDGLQSWLKDLEKYTKDHAEDAALAAGARGKAKMEWVIDHTDSDLKPGKPNRNWTFDMRNALAWEVTRRGTTTKIEAGWLSNQEGYFLIQEHGGVVNGIVVTPMDALMAGHEEMLNTLEGMGLKVQ